MVVVVVVVGASSGDSLLNSASMGVARSQARANSRQWWRAWAEMARARPIREHFSVPTRRRANLCGYQEAACEATTYQVESPRHPSSPEPSHRISNNRGEG